MSHITDKNIRMINWFGRFGNNIIEITSGIYLAKKNNAKFTHDKHHLIDGNEYDFSENVIKQTEIRRSRYLYHIKDIPFQDRIDICHEYIRPRLPWVKDLHAINDDVIVIHIRSGDIFDGYCVCPKTGKKVFCNLGLYPQPPFAFYKKVIDEGKFKKIHIITEKDRRNPTIDMIVREYSNVVVQSGTFEEDANVILSAKHVVPSIGTFSFSLIMLSKKCTTVYLIKDYISPPRLDCRMDESKIDIIWYGMEDYIKLGEWKLNNQNIDRIKNHSNVYKIN